MVALSSVTPRMCQAPMQDRRNPSSCVGLRVRQPGAWRRTTERPSMLRALSLWPLTTHISSHSRVGISGYRSTWRPGIGGVAGVQGALVAYS